MNEPFGSRGKSLQENLVRLLVKLLYHLRNTILVIVETLVIVYWETVAWWQGSQGAMAPLNRGANGEKGAQKLFACNVFG